MPASSPSAKIQILIVENEPIISKEVKMTLERLGYGVCGVAATYQEALSQAHSCRPDLALMDINLDGNKDGIQAAKALRKHYDIPVVFLTSLKELETIQKAKESDPFGYLVKPFRADDLQTSIEIAVYNHQKTSRLQDSLEKFTSAMQALEFPVILLDAEGEIEYMNQKVEELCGWRMEEKLGLSINTLVTADSKPAWQYIQSLPEDTDSEDGSVSAVKMEIATKSGAGKRITGRISRFFQSDTHLAGYLIVLSQSALPENAEPGMPAALNQDLGTHVVDNFIFIKDKSSFYRVPLDSINYVEALGNYVKVHTPGKTYMTLSTLKDIEKMLPVQKFFRIHRSFIIGMDKVTAVHQSDVQIQDKMLPIGKTFREELMKKIKMR